MKQTKQFNRVVVESTDYDSIKHYPFNRACEKHGKLLTKKIAQVNLLRDNPVKVKLEKDGHLYLVDGQGRLFAAKALKVPFYYEQVDSSLPAPEQIKQYNANSTGFKPNDFINLYAKSGNVHYQELQKYLSYGLDLSYFRLICKNGDSDNFKSGKLRIPAFSDTKIQRLKDIGEICNKYKSLCVTYGAKRSRSQMICESVDTFWKLHPKLTKNSIVSILNNVVQDKIDTGTELWFFKRFAHR